jgi:hypothetical protein
VRASRVWAVSVVVALGLGGVASRAAATTARAILGANGIGTVRFGASKARAVSRLSAIFGAPNWRGVNTACGPLWTEVVWNGIAAEFRGDTFTGYRYAAANQIEGMFGVPRVPSPGGFAGLTTAKGISLGSTLAQVRAAYPVLGLVGTDRHKASNGIVFVDNAEHSPASLSSRIIEIKTFNTCGDF